MEKLGGEDGCCSPGSALSWRLRWHRGALPWVSFPECWARSAPHCPPRQQSGGAGGASGANPSQFGAVCVLRQSRLVHAEGTGRFWHRVGCRMGAQLPVWRCVRGVQQLPWALGGEKQGMEPFPAFPLCLDGCWCLALGSLSILWLSSASPSPEPVLLLSCPFCPAPCPCPASQVLLPPCSSMAGWEKRGGCLPRHPWLPRSLMCKDFPLIVLWVQRECVLPGSHS